MICIYHNRDLDGFCSGAIVKKKFPDAKLIGYDYGQPFPIDKISKGETVIMIDVSLPMHAMNDIALLSKDFTWIDHHISAINDYNKFISHGNPEATALEKYCKAVLENGISACEGGWKHFFPNEPMPEAAKFLGQYDTWRNGNKVKWDGEILPFQFGMRLECNSVESFPDILFEPMSYAIEKTIINIVKQGRTILKYQAQVSELNCKKNSFESDVFDYMYMAPYIGKQRPSGRPLRAICLNGGGFNSDVFKSVYNPEIHDVMMPFQFDGKQWTFSLYTTKDEVDCSEIAKRQGGGGHKKAAGFQKKYLHDVFPNTLPV